MAGLSLSQDLKTLLEQEPGEAVTFGELVDRVGDKGFGLLLVILSLPSALPIPAAGYSVPFGLALSLLALQMVCGRSRPWLPGLLRRRSLGPETAGRMLGASAWVFRQLERLVRPRMSWIGRKSGRRFMGVLVLAMALLMMIPLPSTNTAPAAVVFLVGVALSEEDGLFGLGACALGLCAVALYTGLLVAAAVYGPEIFELAKETVRGWLGR